MQASAPPTIKEIETMEITGDHEPVRNRAALYWLIVIGLVEGLSTVLLFFVAMPLKYGPPDLPIVVSVVGPIHGVLFIGYVIAILVVRREIPLSRGMFWWCLVGSVVPLVPFFLEVPLYRRYRASCPDRELSDGS